MRILLVDDHEIIRRGIRSLLALETDYEICGEAVDGLDAVQKARDLEPDLIIMDVSMPGLNGLEATRRIRTAQPQCEVVILTQHDSSQMIEKAFESGARGYVVKSSIARDLVKAVAQVGHHENFVDPAVSARETRAGRVNLKELLQRAEALQRELHESETERKQTEQALRDAQLRERFRLEAANVGTWECNLLTGEVQWSANMEKIHQRAPGSFHGTFESFLEGVHPEDRARIPQLVNEAIQGDGKYFIEYRQLRPDATIGWIAARGQVIYDSKGQAVSIMGVSGDVTDRKQAEILLRQTQAKLERVIEDRTAALEARSAQIAQQNKLLELANDAIIVRSIDHKISYWNQGAERLYGWTREEALGGSPQELLQSDFPIPLAEILSSERWDGEIRQVKRDGTPVTVQSRWAVMRDEKGEQAGWLVINTDITARKKAEETTKNLSGRLLRLQDEERRRISRELHDSAGQYLAGIKMTLDSIQRDLSLVPVEIARKLEEVAGLTEACASEIRTMSHLLHPPLMEELGLASAVRWYVDEFGLRSGVRVHLEIPGKLVRMGGDIELVLFRVLQESLTNVHRHSGSKTAEITIGADANEAWVEVKDHGDGRGFPNPFRPGMGITGMRERVQNLAGVFEITSDPSGTRVRAMIPLAPKHHKDNRSAAKGAKLRNTSSPKSKTPPTDFLV